MSGNLLKEPRTITAWVHILSIFTFVTNSHLCMSLTSTEIKTYIWINFFVKFRMKRKSVTTSKMFNYNTYF